MIDEVAQQLDDVRNEMLRLLQEYPDASDHGREHIYERCESLGGEIQELVGLLKLHICTANRQVAAEADGDMAYASEIARVSHESLAAIHAAGLEVAGAVTMLREARPAMPSDDSLDDDDWNSPA